LTLDAALIASAFADLRALSASRHSAFSCLPPSCVYQTTHPRHCSEDVMKAIATLAVTAALASLATRAAADGPSFSCHRALSAVEARICTTPALASEDRQLAAVYESVKDRIRPRSDVEFLVADQKRWLARRDACGSARCIGRAYAVRIETLESYAVIRDD
jgi:uncharacterized protein YecT (DUF1311 family)